jgi:tRNA(His) 5'-end guanylyltransferase
MNERILQLAQQVCRTEKTGYKPEQNGLPSGVKYMEEFAQLIVQECTNIMLHYTDVDEGVAVVKKHFGEFNE